MCEIIVACDHETGGIGVKNSLPWKLPEDMKRFREITTAAPSGKMNAVIMGRNTWESLNKVPLKNRVNIVVSSTIPGSPRSLDEAFGIVNCSDTIHKVFVIGGGELYKAALTHPSCTKAHVTFVYNQPHSNVQYDAFFQLDLLTATFHEVECHFKSDVLSFHTFIKK